MQRARPPAPAAGGTMPSLGSFLPSLSSVADRAPAFLLARVPSVLDGMVAGYAFLLFWVGPLGWGHTLLAVGIVVAAAVGTWRFVVLGSAWLSQQLETRLLAAGGGAEGSGGANEDGSDGNGSGAAATAIGQPASAAGAQRTNSAAEKLD